MPIPRAIARVNRWLVNPLARSVAGRAPGFGTVVHTGRRSGREFRTPVNVFTTGSGFVVALTYGAEADWVRNVLAAGGCRLVHRGREVGLRDPRLIDEHEAQAAVPAAVRVVLGVLNVHEYLNLSRGAS